MIETIYIERSLRDHPRANSIVAKHSRARVIECSHYGEIFNRKGQNFRLQKQLPSLILANKNGHKIYPTPANHALDAKFNYYFSHLLNCPFDCRYCFLQGKFSSANYVLFVNYEDFLEELLAVLAQHEDIVHVFSGYDCDSLALEPVTGFAGWLIDHIPENERYLIELRTKSAQVRQIRRKQVNKSFLIAYSLAPQAIIDNFEHGTANLDERLAILGNLQSDGWPIGLRIDPLIDHYDWEQTYATFYEQIRQKLVLQDVHSITLGTMRFPEPYYKKIRSLYPENALLASVETDANAVAYPREVALDLLNNAREYFSQHIDPSRIFVHHPQHDP